jgi:DNA modification methylase
MKIELLKSQNIPLSKLETNKGQIDGLPKNPRLIKTEKFEKLKKSIEDNPEMLGMREVLVYPLSSKFVIIGGNMRYQACKELGFSEVPCKILDKDTTAEQLRAITIKDNVGFGEHDWDLLANEWDSIELEEWGLEVPNFETEQTILEAEEDDYEEPENLKVDVVLGDLIEFECTDGRVHRLICGDSTDSDTVAKLIQDEKIELILTDPPYGLGISGQKESKASNPKHNRKYHEDRGWDKSIPDQSVFNYISMFDCDIIIWGGNYFSKFLENSRGWICWSKGQDGQLTMSDGELAWTNINKPLRIVTVNRAMLGKTVHPTQKPIEVIVFSINYSESVGTIMDFYLGSGTTMVASHQLKRKCYGMELDPKYCQVIIDRMQKLDSSIKVKINSKEYNS